MGNYGKKIEKQRNQFNQPQRTRKKIWNCFNREKKRVLQKEKIDYETSLWKLAELWVIQILQLCCSVKWKTKGNWRRKIVSQKVDEK